MHRLQGIQQKEKIKIFLLGIGAPVLTTNSSSARCILFRVATLLYSSPVFRQFDTDSSQLLLDRRRVIGTCDLHGDGLTLLAQRELLQSLEHGVPRFCREAVDVRGGKTLRVDRREN